MMGIGAMQRIHMDELSKWPDWMQDVVWMTATFADPFSSWVIL